MLYLILILNANVNDKFIPGNRDIISNVFNVLGSSQEVKVNNQHWKEWLPL